MTSLRGRLLAMLLSAIAVLWLATAWWSYQDAHHEAEEMLDAQLAQSSYLLLAQVRHELVDEAESRIAAFEAFKPGELHPYEQKLAFRIADGQGRVLLLSSTPPPQVPVGLVGYADVGEWRVLSNRSDELHVEVAQSLAIRDELAREVALHLVLPIFLLLPLLGAIIYILVGRALRPLDALAGRMASRTAANLAAVETSGLPQEVQPLVVALNQLLERLHHALEAERRFTADAAHELRTPLAAIQVQAQVALAGHDSEAGRHALEKVLAGTRRASRLVEQLLRLARLDPLAGLNAPVTVDLATLARSVVEEAGRPQRLRLEIAAASTVQGDADLLGVGLRNLIDNALRYGGEGEVMVRVHAAGVTVEDHGPGVAEAELPRLVERFYRGRDVCRDGSGLGLAIVARIAQLHGARLEFANRAPSGLRVEWLWGPAA